VPRYDVAKESNLDPKDPGQKKILDVILSKLTSDNEWDTNLPFEAAMKEAGELRYTFERKQFTEVSERLEDKETVSTTANKKQAQTFGQLTGASGSSASSSSDGAGVVVTASEDAIAIIKVRQQLARVKKEVEKLQSSGKEFKAKLKASCLEQCEGYFLSILTVVTRYLL
jgi:hypothetical protein